MAKNIDFTSSIERDPACKAKLDRIDALRRQYIDLFTRCDAMMTCDRDTIYCRYVSLIGRRKYENFCLAVEIRALKMKAELAQAAINRNQRPDIAAINASVAAKMKSCYEEMERQAKALRAAETARRINEFTIEELRQLYHTLVRRLHPDLHPGLDENLQDLFRKGVAAYRSCDIDALREIIKRLDMNSHLDDISAKGESIDDTIARLENYVERMKRQIDTLKASFPFTIEKDLLDPAWVKEQQDAQQKERESLESQKKIYEQRIELLTSL